MSKIAKISFSLTSLGMPGLTLSQISILKTFRYLKIRKRNDGVYDEDIFQKKTLSKVGKLALKNAGFQYKNSSL